MPFRHFRNTHFTLHLHIGMKLTLHPTFKTISGMMDDVVYRQVGDQVVIQRRPRARTREWTPAQVAQRERFAQAVSYAQRVLGDPWQREMYAELAKERRRRADKLVTSDFLTPPEVRRVDVSTYHGQPGDLIRIIAVDDIEVVSVQVMLAAATGAVLEQGQAGRQHGVWLYPATTLAPAGERITVSAIATDRPGNQATGTAMYP